MDKRKCFACGEAGHLLRDCPVKKSAAAKPPVKCFSCGEEGHIKRNCPKVSAAEDGAPNKIETTVPFVDTHCHIQYLYERYRHQNSFADLCSQLKYPENFEGCISSFCDPAAFSSFGNWEELLQQNKIWGAFGIHPHNAKYYNDKLEAKITTCMSHPKCVAYGEIGLDYSKHSPSDVATQKSILQHQLQQAVLFHKPVVIHCKDAYDDLNEILTTSLPPDYQIHLHCYSGTPEVAKRFMDHFPSLYIGITAIVTYPKLKNVHNTVANLPLNRLVLETDAPYMLPDNFPKSIRWSNSSMILNIAKEISIIKGKPLDEILESARANTKALYGI